MTTPSTSTRRFRVSLVHTQTYCGGAIDLHFPSQSDYQEFKKAELDFLLGFYHKQVQKRGVWASNQNKYVASPDLFNGSDSRRDWNNYQLWLGKQPKE